MLRKVISFGSLTYLALASMATTFVQAQTPTSTAIKSILVEVTNISRLGGGECKL